MPYQLSEPYPLKSSGKNAFLISMLKFFVISIPIVA